METAVWTVAANMTGKWYRGVLEAAERFMITWHKDEANASGKRHKSAVGGAQGNGKGGGNSRKVDEIRKETSDRVAREQTD